MYRFMFLSDMEDHIHWQHRCRVDGIHLIDTWVLPFRRSLHQREDVNDDIAAIFMSTIMINTTSARMKKAKSKLYDCYLEKFNIFVT